MTPLCLIAQVIACCIPGRLVFLPLRPASLNLRLSVQPRRSQWASMALAYRVSRSVLDACRLVLTRSYEHANISSSPFYSYRRPPASMPLAGETLGYDQQSALSA